MVDLGKGQSVRTVTASRWRTATIVLFLLFLLALLTLGFLAKDILRRKEVCLTAACVKTAASLLGAMDTAADPCVDFFQFACGNWNRQHAIPEDRSSWSTFEVLSENIQLILRGLLEEPLGPTDSHATKKAKDFYASCMNLSKKTPFEAIIGMRAVGEGSLRAVVRDLGGWPVTHGPNWTSTTSPEALLGRVRSELNMGLILELWIGPDDTNSSNNIIQVDQMQLGLPSRDYFLNVSKEVVAYEKYMVDLAVLFGANPTFAESDLKDVVRLETNLANVSMPEADRHDTSAIYQKQTLVELEALVPEFNWREYLQTLLPTPILPHEPIVSYAHPYLRKMARILKHTPKRTVQNYVVWRVLMEITSHLVDEFQEKKLEFRRVLMGVTSERSRWSQCVEWTNKKLGMALGALFIRDNFKTQAKETAQEMISGIKKAFVDLLEENHWMDGATRQVAKDKATKMQERIGYPDYITSPLLLNKEFQNLTMIRSEFLGNLLRVSTWKAGQNLAKLRKQVDKEKWATEPAVVNAFYDPNKNDIGILQPLFYDHYFPKSLNFGGIGVVIGHEITHGFDDKGRQFDSEGNLKEWWNNETIAAFRNQTHCIIDQYSAYEVEGFKVNGRMTQGENIADNGGLKQAFKAFKNWESEHGSEPLLPGMEWLSHEQLFFLNYAQIWCGSMRPEDVLNKIRSAVHSPGPIRVLGPLSNSKHFAEAFACALGTRMNPAKKCVVW